MRFYWIILEIETLLFISCSEVPWVVSKSPPLNTVTIRRSQCSRHNLELTSGRLNVTPYSWWYKEGAKVQFVCQHGLYLQQPGPGATLSTQCEAGGRWQTQGSVGLTCSNSCREWSMVSHDWGPIRSNLSHGEAITIQSPGYPGSIQPDQHECIYRISMPQSTLRVRLMDLSLASFSLNISTDHGLLQLPSSNRTEVVTSYESVTIRLVQRNKDISNSGGGKIERFKLTVDELKCVLREIDDSVVLLVHRQIVSASEVSERYSCPAPYELHGSRSVHCHRGRWSARTLQGPPPRCVFVCKTARSLLITDRGSFSLVNEAVHNLLGCVIKLKSASRPLLMRLLLYHSATAPTEQLCWELDSAQYQESCFQGGLVHLATPAVLRLRFTAVSAGATPSSKQETVNMTVLPLPDAHCPLQTRYSATTGLKVVMANRSLLSKAVIRCLDNFVLQGSSHLTCLPLPSGQMKWRAQQTPKCNQICSDQTADTIWVGEENNSVIWPLFAGLNFTAGQKCQWSIEANQFHPIIQINSNSQLTRYVNVTVWSHSDSSLRRRVPSSRLLNYNGSRVVFVCPVRRCVLRIRPLATISGLKTSAGGRQALNFWVSVKLNDQIPNINRRDSLYIFMVGVGLLVTAAVLVYADITRHPYTGCTARLLVRLRRPDRPGRLTRLTLGQLKVTLGSRPAVTRCRQLSLPPPPRPYHQARGRRFSDPSILTPSSQARVKKKCRKSHLP